MLKEFREFVSRGNVVDLAVAVIIGTAFTAIVTSLVNDIIMPLIGVLLGGIDFSSLAITVGESQITYGNFVQSIINFLIIAFVIFLMIRTINRAQERFSRAEEAAPAAPPEPSDEVKLLREIRDLLQKQSD